LFTAAAVDADNALCVLGACVDDVFRLSRFRTASLVVALARLCSLHNLRLRRGFFCSGNRRWFFFSASLFSFGHFWPPQLSFRSLATIGSVLSALPRLGRFWTSGTAWPHRLRFMPFFLIFGSAPEQRGSDAPLSTADSGAGFAIAVVAAASAAPDAVGAPVLAARAAFAEDAAVAACGGASSGVGSVVAAFDSAPIDVPAKPAGVCADAEPADLPAASGDVGEFGSAEAVVSA